MYKHYHDFANLWPFLAFFCHISHFTHNLCKALVDIKDYTRYILWLFCIYILFFYEFASENWLILEGIVFIILVWWLRFPIGGGHFCMHGELCVLPHCIQSMRVPTKFGCFICLESIRNEFMPLGKDLLAAKLNYLQRGGGCCKKSEKSEKF